MTFLALARLALLRQLRDPASLLLSLTTAPLFALLFALVSADTAAFSAYLPSLLVFSSIMAVFGAAMALSRERAEPSLLLLRMAGADGFALVAGFALPQAAINLTSLLLTLLAAQAAGFHSDASMPLLATACALATVASIGIGLLVAALAPSVTRAFLLASLVMFLQLLFSGLLFPRPEQPSVVFGASRISLWDLLPTTHLHHLLTALLQGTHTEPVRFAALALLAAASLLLGGLLFQRALRAGARS